MTEWKKFTGSYEQIREILLGEHGVVFRYADGSKKVFDRLAEFDPLILPPVQEYLIREHKLHAAPSRYIEVMDYLIKRAGNYVLLTANKSCNEHPEIIQNHSDFVRWVDDDWRKVDITGTQND